MERIQHIQICEIAEESEAKIKEQDITSDATTAEVMAYNGPSVTREYLKEIVIIEFCKTIKIKTIDFTEYISANTRSTVVRWIGG